MWARAHLCVYTWGVWQEALEARASAEAAAAEAARQSTEAALRDLTIGLRLKACRSPPPTSTHLLLFPIPATYALLPHANSAH